MRKTKRNAGKKKAESGCHAATAGNRQVRNLVGKPQTCGDTQINGNVLN